MYAQRGNALFLILIAVVLFAGLSYAVTRSSRSGGGIEKETTLLDASQITQYGSIVRQAVTRMILTGSIDLEIDYTPPNVSNPYCETDPTHCLFYSDGGGIDHFGAPLHGALSQWIYGDGGNYVQDLGSNTSVSGREAIAALVGVPLSVCSKINQQLGIGTTIATNAGALDELPATTTAPTPLSNILLNGTNGTVIDAYPGQPFGCVNDPLGTTFRIYYHTLIER